MKIFNKDKKNNICINSMTKNPKNCVHKAIWKQRFEAVSHQIMYEQNCNILEALFTYSEQCTANSFSQTFPWQNRMSMKSVSYVHITFWNKTLILVEKDISKQYIVLKGTERVPLMDSNLQYKF